MIVPPGDLTITSDAVIEDSGLPDPIELDANEVPVEQLPDETLVFLLRQPLLRNRQACRYRVAPFRVEPAWLGRVQAICDFVLRPSDRGFWSEVQRF